MVGLFVTVPVRFLPLLSHSFVRSFVVSFVGALRACVSERVRVLGILSSAESCSGATVRNSRALWKTTKNLRQNPPPPPHLPSIWALVEYGSVVAILPSSVFFPIGLDKVGRLRLLFQFILSIYLCVFSLCLSPSLFWRVAMSRLPLSFIFFLNISSLG